MLAIRVIRQSTNDLMILQQEAYRGAGVSALLNRPLNYNAELHGVIEIRPDCDSRITIQLKNTVKFIFHAIRYNYDKQIICEPNSTSVVSKIFILKHTK